MSNQPIIGLGVCLILVACVYAPNGSVVIGGEQPIQRKGQALISDPEACRSIPFPEPTPPIPAAINEAQEAKNIDIKTIHRIAEKHINDLRADNAKLRGKLAAAKAMYEATCLR